MLTPEQLANRHNTIGSSEIAALAGLNPWSGPLDIWLRKGAQAAAYQADEHNAELMALGHLMEPVIGKLAMDKIGGGDVRKCGETFTHRDHAWATATPDFLRLNGEWSFIIEAKNVGYRAAFAWDNGPPAYVDAQLQWQLECCDIDAGYIAALIGGRDFQLHKVKRDREYGASLLRIAERFWTQHVLTGEPPPVDGSKDSSEFLRKRYPKHKQPMKGADARAQALVRSLQDTRTALADAKARDAAAQNQLCEWLGDAGGVETDTGKITWRTSKPRKKVDWEAIARQFEPTDGMIEKHTSTGKPSRRFVATFK